MEHGRVMTDGKVKPMLPPSPMISAFPKVLRTKWSSLCLKGLGKEQEVQHPDEVSVLCSLEGREGGRGAEGGGGTVLQRRMLGRGQ